MKYKAIIVFSVMGVVIPVYAWSQVYEKSRHETKTCRVYKETALEVYNKYGNVQLFIWDKDSVRIDIDLQIKASKEAKVDKIFEYIDFDLSESKYFVIARTQLNQQGAFWAEVSDLANTLFSGGTVVQIDYDVYLPQNLNIRIENKFGNIYTTDHTGKTNIILSNGDLKANDLTGNSDLQISFGNASVNHIESGKLTLNYSEFDLGSAGTLNLESKSSTVNISKIGSLDLNSRRDKIRVDEANVVSGVTSFSYLTLKSFTSDLTLKADYGEIKLDAVNPDFKLVEINSNYTDVLLKLPVNASYSVNIFHTGSTEITSPQNYSGLRTEIIDKKADQYKTSGITGSSSVKKGKINMHIVSGKVSFREAL